MSISRIRHIRSNDTTTPPATGMHAPDSPVPDPRPVTGIPWAPAHPTMATTSAVEPGRTTARGRTGEADRASSWVSSSLMSHPESMLAAPTIPASSSITVMRFAPDRRPRSHAARQWPVIAPPFRWSIRTLPPGPRATPSTIGPAPDPAPATRLRSARVSSGRPARRGSTAAGLASSAQWKHATGSGRPAPALTSGDGRGGFLIPTAARRPAAAHRPPEMSAALPEPARQFGRMQVAGPGDPGQRGEHGHGDEAPDPGHVVVHGRGHAGVLVGHGSESRRRQRRDRDGKPQSEDQHRRQHPRQVGGVGGDPSEQGEADGRQRPVPRSSAAGGRSWWPSDPSAPTTAA